MRAAASKTAAEFRKFLLVGALNFFLTLVLFYLFVEKARIDYIVSLFAVSAIGWIFTYVLNYMWTFQPEPHLTYGPRLVKYVSTGLASVIVNALALKVLVTSTTLSPFWAQLCLVPFVIALNFAAAKFWSLRST